MWATMKLNNGYGLAAPQVGENIQLLVFDCSEETYNTDNQAFMINPKIIEVGEEYATMEEGCLSFPGLFINISRPDSVCITYTNLGGERQTRTFTGIAARIIQHEYDHLKAVLLTDHEETGDEHIESKADIAEESK